MPAVIFAFLTVSFICCSNFRSLIMMAYQQKLPHPFLSWAMHSSFLLSIKYLYSGLLFPTCKILHLSLLNLVYQSVVHCTSKSVLFSSNILINVYIYNNWQNQRKTTSWHKVPKVLVTAFLGGGGIFNNWVKTQFTQCFLKYQVTKTQWIKTWTVKLNKLFTKTSS